MKIILIPVFMALVLLGSCSRASIPGRIDRLNEERAEAMHTGDKPVEVPASKKKKRNKNKKGSKDARVSKSKNAAEATILPQPVAENGNGKYLDTSYANQTYRTLTTDYADTVSAMPDHNIKDLKYADNFVGTTNFNLRKPQYVIIHHTAQQSVEQTLRTFTLERTQVSAHYVIGRDGSVHHMLNDYLRAWQAGSGRWNNITDMNSCSIGIELDNDGFMPFTDKQIESLLKVLKGLKERFDIPTSNFIGHADFAPLRKNDPNVHFPWAILAKNGFGYWWDDTTAVQVPTDFNEYLALRIIGYDVKDVSKAIIAFRRHFCGVESAAKILSPEERKILYRLYTKYL